MTAKTAAQRQAEKRERDRMKEEERLARLLSRRISLDLYKSTDMALMRAVTLDREVDSVIVAGTLKEPMEKTPDWLQAVWIEAGRVAEHEHQAAA